MAATTASATTRRIAPQTSRQTIEPPTSRDRDNQPASVPEVHRLAPDWTELAAENRQFLKRVQASGHSAKVRENRSKAQGSRIQMKVFQESALFKGLCWSPNHFVTA